MGKKMTLLKIIEELETFDNESTIYAEEPWTENSKALVLHEPESGELPYEAKKLGLHYFLEVFVARDFLEDWAINLKAANLNAEPTVQQKFARLIHYAIYDV